MTHSPWAVLQTVSTKRLEETTSDPVFQKALAEQTEASGAAAASSWFHRAHPGSPLTAVAYFSMEYMLSEALPIYSGGLGNVAGDQLKAASDLGVPGDRRRASLPAGLFPPGYRRATAASGRSIPFNDPGQLPIRPVRDAERRVAAACAWTFPVSTLDSDLGSASRPRQALPARHQRSRQPAGIPRHHERTLRRRPGPAPAAGTCARHRRLAFASHCSGSSPKSAI